MQLNFNCKWQLQNSKFLVVYTYLNYEYKFGINNEYLVSQVDKSGV